MNKVFFFTAQAIVSIAILTSCGNNPNSTSLSDEEELGQQVGDVMASIDESGGSSGSLDFQSDDHADEHATVVLDKSELLNREISRLENRYADVIETETRQSSLSQAVNLSDNLNSRATCGQASEFSSCSSNVITRNFGGCTLGLATFSGTVTLTWATAATACALTGATGTISRLPNFTVTGRRGATLTVSKKASGVFGQRLTWASGTGTSKVFNFTNDGINRKFTTAGGSTLLDITSETTSAITITGTSRSNRVMNGGTLRITNNVSGVTCDISPTNVTWNNSSCNCARSGTWSGTCSNSQSYSLTLNGCGAGSLTVGSTITSITFDRCTGG